jgi:hypothetical protein
MLNTLSKKRIGGRSLFCLLFTSLFFSEPIYSQVDSVLNRYEKDFYHEKIHVHFDRSRYTKGQTVYYKAYILTENLSLTTNKNFYVDWYDETGMLIQQTAAPISYSGAQGSFEIPATYAGKSIELRAYTKWMLNSDKAFIYSGAIAIYQPTFNKKDALTKVFEADSSFLEIYPEGGFSLAGLTNHLAFRAINNKGFPTSVQGVIKNAKGQILDSIHSVHDGMGSFKLLMNKNESYTVEWMDSKQARSVKVIAAQKPNGLCLQVNPLKDKAVFTIEATPQIEGAVKDLHLLIHKDQALYYKLDIKMAGKTKISSEISTVDLPDGVVQFTLFDSNWIPIAERIIFIDNHKHTFFSNVGVTILAKGKNKLTISVNDTLITNLSLAITNSDFYNENIPNIFSDLLLRGDLKGPVYNAAYYLSDNSAPDSIVRCHVDLLMLTQGHRQYDWDKIVSGQLPVINFPQDSEYIQVKGKILFGKNADYKDGLFVNGLLQTKDSSKFMMSMRVNKDGNFVEKNRFFYDTAYLFYTLIGNLKRNRNFTVSFENGLLTDSVRRKYFGVNNQNGVTKNSFTHDTNNDTNILKTDAYFSSEWGKALQFKNTLLLKEVIVKAKIKTPLQILDQYYSSGFYTGENNNYRVDVEGDVHSSGYNSIFSYLQTKVPGFRVSNGGGGEVPLWYPNSQGLPAPPAFLLDEVPVSLESVKDVSITSIAYVKAFKPPFLGSMLNGFSGVIVLYSKRGYSPLHDNQNTPGLERTVLKGYTKFREFINDDAFPLSDNNSIMNPTAYWNPFILTDKNNQIISIEFNNNGNSKKLCAVLEGIDANGKLTRSIKVIE